MEKKPFISYLATHRNPHRDECLAIWLFMMFGEKRYDFNPDTLRLRFLDSDRHADEFRVARRRDNIEGLLIGIGTSPLNEHGLVDRKPNSSAALLMAEYLGVADLKTLSKLLEIATLVDNEGGEEFDSQANMMKLLHRHSRLSEEDVVWRSFQEFDAMYESAIQFHLTCPKEFDAEGRRETVNGIRVGFMQSDRIDMANSMRVKRQCQVTIVRKSTGHVAMFFGQNHADKESGFGKRLALAVIPEVIRAECWNLEFSAQLTGEIVAAAVKALEENRALSLPGLNKRWYLLGNGNMLLNGSEAQPGVEPSSISNDQLRAAIHTGLAKL